MSDCCSSENRKAINREKIKITKLECPTCGKKSLTVSQKTILHHMDQSWQKQLSDQAYFYCRDAKCGVVYFTEDQQIIEKSSVRTRIGIKEDSDKALICYCFGVNKSEATTNKNAKAFVVKMTKESMCSCDTANPSGRCCLRDFPKFK